MKPGSPGGFSSISPFPKLLSPILLSAAGLASFLIFASWFFISHPHGSSIQAYFLGIENLTEWVIVNPNQTEILIQPPGSLGNSGEEASDQRNSLFSPSYLDTESNGTKIDQPFHEGFANDSSHVDSGGHDGTLAPSYSTPATTVLSSPNTSKKIDTWSCDLYQGKWFYDPSGPLYTNNTCPIITPTQNCQNNGRPDKDYENWRWKPSQCDLPRFDAKKFLELMRGKKLAFIGDSVARNQMESLMCILWQVEIPKNRGNRRMQRWYFKSTSATIIRIWSSWLVHKTSEPFQFAPEGIDKLHLDVPDEALMDFLPTLDVVVISSGHWFAKRSVYVLNDEIVGGQLWWPDKSRTKKVNSIEAFGISTETIVTAIATHPNYTGLTIVRSFSPDHYEGGAWNTGGSCTGKVRPAVQNELVENGYTDVMHEKQVTGFKKALMNAPNKSKLRFMDITGVFSYRHDGHPGPYRSTDPNKVTKRGPHGEPPPQDCLHWCMPGPVDTWNEIVLEIIRREFEAA